MSDTADDMSGSEGASHKAPAVARAATILRLLAGQQVGLGVNEIARRVGLVPSTCLHVLRALVDEGFVAFDEDRKTYRTGLGLLTLVRSVLANSSFPRAVQPALDALATEFPVTAIAVEMDRRDRMVVVSIARSDGFISLHVNLGSRFPAYISATGRCFAANSGLSRAQLKARFDALRWDRAPEFEQWLQEVDLAREGGIGLDRGNYVRGLTVAATLLPVMEDQVCRGISVVGFEHQLTGPVIERLGHALRETPAATAVQLS